MENKNELIAKFMGMSRREFKGHGVINYEWLPEFPHSNWCFRTPPPFHVSWDWLIPVVEKIESFGGYFSIGTNSVELGIFEIFSVKHGNFLKYRYQKKFEGQSKITNTYNAVVDFVEWYLTRMNESPQETLVNQAIEHLIESGYQPKTFFYAIGGGEDESDSDIFVREDLDIAIYHDYTYPRWCKCKYSELNYTNGLPQYPEVIDIL